MDREQIIQNLKYEIEKHKNDKVDTFATNISLMCKNILDYLENDKAEDCISRQAVLEALNSINGTSELDKAFELIENLPHVTPTRKAGKWIKSNIGGAKVCSICQAHMGLSNFKYCPNCGADMREATNEINQNS